MNETIKAVLKALGYTPAILAEAIGISQYKARRILKDDGEVYLSEFLAICRETRMPPSAFEKRNAKTSKGGGVA